MERYDDSKLTNGQIDSALRGLYTTDDPNYWYKYTWNQFKQMADAVCGFDCINHVKGMPTNDLVKWVKDTMIKIGWYSIADFR